MVLAAVIAGFGWQMGYLSTAAAPAPRVVLLMLFMHDSPQSSGFPSINVIRDEPREEVEARGSVFKNTAAGAAQPGAVDPRPRLRLYVHRPLRRQLMGSSFSEQDESDIPPQGVRDYRRQRYRRHRRRPSSPACSPTAFSLPNRGVMAGFISLLNTAGFALMLWSPPHNYYTDILAMIIFQGPPLAL